MTLLRHILPILLAGLLLSPTAIAQPLADSLARRVDSLFSIYADPAAPGCACGIYRDGRLLYAKGYGSADLEHAVLITPASVFDIGSTSKQFTAASIVLLAQQGKLSLDDDIRKHLPEMPDYGRTITIRHLLHHTSGLRDYIGLMIMSGHDIDDVTSPKDVLRLMARQKTLDFQPGTDHVYSNTGYFLASIIVERASGMTLREFARKNIFEPLGMTHTNYVDDHTAIVPNRAIGYSPKEGGSFARNISNWEQTGDGAVFTTVEDLVKWDWNFYEPKVGGEALIGELLRRGILNSGDSIGYALGLFHDKLRGLATVHHGGSWGGYVAQMLRVPSERFSVAVLCNREDAAPGRLANRVAEAILADRFPEPPRPARPATAEKKEEVATVAMDSAQFARYEGNYELAIQPGFVITVGQEGTKFYAQATGQGPVDLLPTSDSTFILKGVNGSLTFHREAGGKVSSLTLHQGGNFMARRLEPLALPAKELARYTGEYHSQELGVSYTLVVENGKLVAKNPALGDVTLTPRSASHFVGSSWNISEADFEKGKGGKMGAMVVSAGRVTNLRFERK